MGADGARTKGVGFANVKAFVTEHFGESGWDAVLGSMEPGDRQDLLAVTPVGWYSLMLYARLIRAADAVHGKGDLALVEAIGRYEAQHDLTSIHRIFLKLVNPAYVVEQLAKLWTRFHDTGSWEVTRFTTTHATAVLRDWGCADAAMCRELTGYLARSLEICGGHGVVVEHTKCRARGDDVCVFEGRWRG